MTHIIVVMKYMTYDPVCFNYFCDIVILAPDKASWASKFEAAAEITHYAVSGITHHPLSLVFQCASCQER